MAKFFKHMQKDLRRLVANAKNGSALDIVIISSGVVLGATLVGSVAWFLISSARTPADASTASSVVLTQYPEDSSAASGGAVTPFSGASAASASSSRSGASSSRSTTSQSASRSNSGASASSRPADYAGAGAGTDTQTPSQSSSNSQSSSSQPQPAPHTHSYGAWTPEAKPCMTTPQTRYCLTDGCTAFETRTVAVTAAHRWDENVNVITNATTGEIIASVHTCTVCGAQLTQYQTGTVSQDTPEA